MAAVSRSMQQHPACCSDCAAASTSARYGLIADTVIAAVSAFIVFLPGFPVAPVK